MGAGHLKIGDQIKQADGTTGLVANVTTVQQTREMFNLTVSEAHTYYVGQDEWLVHNANCYPLAAHEIAGGHLLSRHVGWTINELAVRLRGGTMQRTSSFIDENTAQMVVDRALNDPTQVSRIRNWIAGSSNSNLVVPYSGRETIGYGIDRATGTFQTSSAQIILKKDASVPGGWRILTGYPTP